MNSELQEYLTTGMLGAYHPENAILRENDSGGVDTIFRDTSCWEKEGGFVHERQMLIGEKHFYISSVFSTQPTATPTDKLLALIDTKLKKETRST